MVSKEYTRVCECGNIQHYTTYHSYHTAKSRASKCRKCGHQAISRSRIGKRTWPVGQRRTQSQIDKHRAAIIGRPHTQAHREKCRVAQRNRYSQKENRLKTSLATKVAMHRPEIRKKHLAALAETHWFGTTVDKGQIELLMKWNRLGFNFQPNYQVYNKTDLFYVDGYDVERNVVIEYDSKYHNKPAQREKDLIRQTKIIDILKPVAFWRYNAVNGQFRNVVERARVSLRQQ